MPTLADIAKIAGVGVMSVSRVVNGTRRVTPEVERKVRAAIERIGYVPNEAARILKGYRSRVLGLIVPDLSDPFFATCANAIQETAWDAGYMTLMAASGHSENLERRETEIMVQRKVAGLLVIPSGSQNEHFRAAREAGIPIVSFDRPMENVESDTLVVNNRDASAMLVEHLIEHGHENILCVADDEKVFTRAERVAGYTLAMRRAKLPIRVCLFGPMTGTLADQLSFALESNPVPTAIFAESNRIGVEVLRELRKRSLKIPDQIAFVGFDDFEAATLVDPAITVVRQPEVELGRKAASMLLARLSEKPPLGSVRTVLPTELIIRESCGCGRPQKPLQRTRAKKALKS